MKNYWEHNRRSVPEGRQNQARGASPWKSRPVSNESPVRGDRCGATHDLCRPSGALDCLFADSRGLRPWLHYVVPPGLLHNPSFLLTLLLLGLLLGLLTGCEEQVSTTYGRRGMIGASSVNGTSVLSSMCESAGHRVKSWRYLSPMLYETDVIVWAPDDYEPPTKEVWEWLWEWLYASEGNARVLLYIGRDYDAGPEYWRRMKPKTAPPISGEYAQREKEAEQWVNMFRPATLKKSSDASFTFDRMKPKASVKSLTGPWAAGIDSQAVRIPRHTRLLPPEDADMLLGDEQGQPLVSEWADEEWEGRLILVENGSFLLNLPLVNTEHRKLAGKLVTSLGPPERSVIFLESGPGGPPIFAEDPTAEPPTGFALFGVWPISAVLLQLAALGIVFSLMRWLVFGVPRRLPRESLTDFGDHVSALGRLLASSRDRAYAYERLKEYFRV